MMDPVNFQRMSELRYQEYQEIADQVRNSKPLHISMSEAAHKVISRLTALTQTAPAQPVTDMTEACVEC